MATDKQPEYDEKGVESLMKRTPDAELVLSDEGITLPPFLRGYVGSFTIRTPSITGNLEATGEGMPDEHIYDGMLASYPSDGEYNEDIPSGCLAISTDDHPEIVFNVVDERSEDTGD